MGRRLRVSRKVEVCLDYDMQSGSRVATVRVIVVGSNFDVDDSL
jgi:hypothetical protein